MSDRIRIIGKNYYVDLREDKYRGYFEHLIHGDERGGELLIDRGYDGELYCFDFDGVPELPEEVAELLNELGINTDEVF